MYTRCLAPLGKTRDFGMTPSILLVYRFPHAYFAYSFFTTSPPFITNFTC